MDAITCAQEYSPYLAESLRLFPEVALGYQEKGSAYLMDLVDALPKDVADLTEEMRRLRIHKRQAHLVIALADLSRDWDWVSVTEHLTELADMCLQRILRAAANEQSIVGTDDNPVPGLFILAVGKYGARELNYSSDVDFNVFYDPDKIKVPNPNRAERTLIKLVQSVIKGMEAITEHGYIFRTDLRLRPDPRSNAIAVSTLTAERYYETIGQNWERAAMIKARVCAGDMEAGQAFIDHTLSPFIWRKNMDYAAIEDILAIKRQINAKVGAGENLILPGHNIKLGYGGIREIEFYAQVQQLILGGRHESLRTPRTVEALSALSELNFIPVESAKFMREAYSILRTAEHALQMIDDAQTHDIPTDTKGQTQMAGLMGEKDFQALSISLEALLRHVRHTYMALFPEAGSLSSREGNMVFTGVEPDPGTLNSLTKLGYKDGETVWYDMAAWLGGRIGATRAEKARELLTVLAPTIIENCADTGQADKAFNRFRKFFTALGSGVSLLSMFRQRPEHLKYVIDLMTQSELIGTWLGEKPAILDALSDPQFLNLDHSDVTRIENSIKEATDFEAALNLSRRQVRETKFRITAALLSKRIDETQAGQLYSQLAESSIAALLPYAITEAERRDSKMTGEIAVLGMGKLASKQLNLNSDLDIMLIYRPGANEESAQAFYARITQRLISALSAVTEEGPLYEVDMALRPSGRSGPVAVSVQAFESYYAEKAWSWEFMALSRSRVVCSTTPEFGSEISNLRAKMLDYPRPDLDISADIAEMLRRVRQEKEPENKLDLKNAIGGIRDIEFIAQKLFLVRDPNIEVEAHLITELLTKLLGNTDPKQAEFLKETYGYYLAITHQIAIRTRKLPADLSPRFASEIARNMGYASSGKFFDDLEGRQQMVSQLVNEFVLT